MITDTLTPIATSLAETFLDSKYEGDNSRNANEAPNVYDFAAAEVSKYQVIRMPQPGQLMTAHIDASCASEQMRMSEICIVLKHMAVRRQGIPGPSSKSSGMSLQASTEPCFAQTSVKSVVKLNSCWQMTKLVLHGLKG
uniref:Uncharacterized protein n=1 Tax=Pristionchus pacificus TaxID=54126 RepID=A0A2A6CHQ0_PRIPA|eukprot:PDM77626.1 hypothetical protein PRIPAC_34493 [Pristionchus pacificus]